MSKQDVELGHLIKDSPQRDAVHIAVAPVWSKEILTPGQHVKFVPESTTQVVGCKLNDKDCIGIVDPFLKEDPDVHDKFWVCLWPRSITSLRHDWTHPAFTAAANTGGTGNPAYDAAVAMIKAYAEEIGVSYGRLMEVARDCNNSTGRRWDLDYIYLNFDTPDCVYENIEEFWKNYEIVTGEKARDKTETFVSCTC